MELVIFFLFPFFQFELQERKKARSEYDKLLFRQEMEVEELRVSSESALKELQLLQVSCLSPSMLSCSRKVNTNW